MFIRAGLAKRGAVAAWILTVGILAFAALGFGGVRLRLFSFGLRLYGG
jgi:hypothetical protein